MTAVITAVITAADALIVAACIALVSLLVWLLYRHRCMFWRPGRPMPEKYPPRPWNRRYLPARSRSMQKSASQPTNAVIQAHEWRVNTVRPARSGLRPTGRRAKHRIPRARRRRQPAVMIGKGGLPWAG